MGARVQKKRRAMTRTLVRETLYGEPYEYFPLGRYIVAARGVCGGRPTIKYHRLDARHIIGFLKRGDTPKQIARNYPIPVAAVHEAVELALLYDYEKCYARKQMSPARCSQHEQPQSLDLKELHQ